VVFVEVKTRHSDHFGQPFEAVTDAKRHKLTSAALVWLKRHRLLERRARFDVVSIIWSGSGDSPQITHYKNAFEPTGRGQFFS
jgi:putative endonuclease